MALLSNTLIINCQFPSARRRTYPSDITCLPFSVLDKHGPKFKPKLLTTDKPVIRKVQHCPEPSARQRHLSTVSNLNIHFLTLVPNTIGRRGPVCAIFRDNCQKNFISNRIVKRFTLTTYVDRSANTSTVVAGECRITPSCKYVTLVAPTATGNEQTPYRFYVVEHCLERFDVLIGSDIITNLSSSAKKDEPIGPLRPIRSKP
jgi:hypothetical protein